MQGTTKMQREDILIIAYYPFRAKAQVARLLCQFLHVPYKDQFFDPISWKQFHEKESKNHPLLELPFLKDGDFIVCGHNAMINYIAEKAGSTDILGRSLRDKTKLEYYKNKGDPKECLLKISCSSRNSCPQEKSKSLQTLWTKKVCPLFKEYQSDCSQGDWFFSYPTVLDLVLLESVNLFQCMFKDKMNQFPKLLALRDKVSSVTQIKNYEQSANAVTEHCPVRYFQKFKNQKCGQKSSKCQNSSSNMDVQ